MEWEPERSLRVRMAFALALVVMLPLAFVWTMTTALNWIVLPLADFLLAPQFGRIGFDPFLVFVLTLLGLGVAYVVGERMTLRSVDARRVDEAERPELHARLRRLATTAGVPKPELAIIDSEVPNAFATGRSQSDATIAVTEGLVEALEDDELDAVLAHELAHVRNRDAIVMTVAYLLPTLTFYVAMVAYHALSLKGQFLTNVRISDADDLRAVLVLGVLFVVTTIVTMTVSAVFWAASFLLFRVLSRYREHTADRGAAAITGNPLALASALDRIDDEMQSRPDTDLRDLDGGVEALYVSSLDVQKFTDDDPALISQDMFPDTHPPTDERIERLQDLSAELEAQTPG